MSNFIKKHIRPLLLISFLIVSIIGQSQKLPDSFKNFVTYQQNSKSPSDNILASDIEGSPYLNDEFISGSILTAENDLYQDIPLRYNIYNDDVEFMKDENEYLAISDPTTIREIKIGDKTFIYDNLDTKKSNEFGYYQIVVSGKVDLLLRYNVVFKDTEPSTGFNRPGPPEFERNADTFFLKVGDNSPQEISRKKHIESIFGNQSKAIKSYIKSEKINLRKRDQLVKLVDHLNQIN